MKTRKLCMLFHLYVAFCVVLILHYNGLLRSPSAFTFDQSLIKGNWKWHTLIEMRLKWITIPYFHTSLIWEIRKWSMNTDNLGFSLLRCSYYGNITSKHSQFYYWHSKEHILPSCLCFTMKWWNQNYFVNIFLPLNSVGIQYILEIK